MKKHPISELDDRLGAWADGIEDASDLMQKLGDAALRASRPRTPVRTGELVSSEGVRAERDRAFLYAAADHARYVHDGTRFMPARPFFEEGVQDASGEFVDIVRDWAEDIFTREVAR